MRTVGLVLNNAKNKKPAAPKLPEQDVKNKKPAESTQK